MQTDDSLPQTFPCNHNEPRAETHMFGVRQFARLPDELAEGDQHRHAHAAQQHHEHAAHVVDAQLVGVHFVVVRLR